MKTLQLPAPSEKQKQFIADRHKHLAFGGSRGGGKSFAVRLSAIILAYRYAGIKIMIVRKTYPELTANHIKPLTEMLKCYAPNKKDRFASYNDSKKEIVFPNGSTILFRYCDSEKDSARFQGTECDALFVDEATQQPEEIIKRLTACVRGVNNFPKLIRYTCNPGGVGHEWMKRLFIQRNFNNGEDPEDFAFIQSSVYDNKALLASNPDYVKQLEALPPLLRQMWLYGNWDIADGMFFSDLRTEPDLNAAHEHCCDDTPEQLRRDHRWCHVIEPFDLSKGECRTWQIVRSFDFGYNKPSAFLYFAVSHDDVWYLFMEVYLCTDTPNEGLKWTPDQQFAHIAKIEREHPWLKGRKITGIADPAIWDASRGESIARTASRYGLHFVPGDHERVAGWMQVHYRLQFTEEGYARLYIFQNCKHTIRTLPLLMYDEHHPEDLNTSQEDHIADALRYALMSSIVAPLRPVEKKQVYIDPLDQINIRKERRP